MSATEFVDPGALLPHGPGIRFIRRIIACDELAIECEVLPGVKEQAFARNGKVSPAVTLEYMAQAIAAFVSILTSEDEEEPGFIVAVRRFQVRVPELPLHRPLRVRATHRWGEATVGRFDAVVLADGDTVSEASLTVFRPEKEDE